MEKENLQQVLLNSFKRGTSFKVDYTTDLVSFFEDENGKKTSHFTDESIIVIKGVWDLYMDGTKLVLVSDNNIYEVDNAANFEIILIKEKTGEKVTWTALA